MPWKFFLLVFLLSIPFWAVGGLSGLQLLPALPISALSVICVAAAAAVLVYRESGWTGVKAWLKRCGNFRRAKVKIWLIPAVLLMPVIMTLSFLIMRLEGVPLPAPSFSVVKVLALFAAFLIGALAEELGWTGYAIDPLQERWHAWGAALIIGVVWAVMHVIPLMEARRTLGYIAWWSLGTVAYRFIIVWLYNNAGSSVFVAALFHAMVNLTWQLFPVNGSYYDPRVTGLIAAGTAALIVIVWGPERLHGRVIL